MGQRQDVFASFTQRGKGNHIESQPIQQVGTELTLFGERRQILVGSANDADVGADRIVAADSLELSIFDDTQDFLLHPFGGIGQLVEEQAAFVRQLETAEAPARCPGEGAGFVAKQLGFQQGLGESSAVELDERTVPARRQVVNPRSDQFLAGSTLANDQHRPVQLRDTGDPLQNFQKSG